MCSNPIRIPNNSSYVNFRLGSQLFIYVPCGRCHECRVQAARQWRLRLYFDLKDCMYRGYYILFDTLTYRDSCLPRISRFVDVPSQLDFSCFSMNDIQTFMNRVRKHLGRGIRFFVASEYGSVDRTTRPHYHILLSFPRSYDYRYVSRVISDAWSFGRTDGVRYRGAGYVRNHNLMMDFDKSCSNVVKYLSNYVNKDVQYQQIANSRIKSICSYYAFSGRALKDFRNSLEYYVRPFHTQSKFFGYGLLNVIDVRSYMENGFFKIPAFGSVAAYKLPISMLRKLFYSYKRENGRVSWSITPLGLEFKRLQFSSVLRQFCNSVMSFKIDTKSTFDVKSFADWYFCRRDLPYYVPYNPKFVYAANGIRSYLGDGNFAFRFVSRIDRGNRYDGYDLFPMKLESSLSSRYSVVPLHVLDKQFNEGFAQMFSVLQKYLDWKKSKGEQLLACDVYLSHLKNHYKCSDF